MLKFSNILLSIVFISVAGCVPKAPQSNLESVAKNWSMTIRAGQIFPVFPLEEDIRPGDVYLADMSSDDEVETWTEEGFLPLTNRYDRIKIPSSVYRKIYDHEFTANDKVSFHRRFQAAIPSYSFSLDRRGGLGASLPISSVPVAFALAGAQSANGTIVFTNATSYGLPDRVIKDEAMKWLENNPGVAKLLAGKSIRVITRVFAIKGINVSMSFSGSGGAKIQAGSPQNFDLLLGTSISDYSKRIIELNKSIELINSLKNPSNATASSPVSESDESSLTSELKAELKKLQELKTKIELDKFKKDIMRSASINDYGGYMLPGAKLNVVSRSGNGVSMNETFDRPLVVGYWAIEMQVLGPGKISSYIPLQNKFSLSDSDPERAKIRAKKAQEILNTSPKKPKPIPEPS